MRYILLGLILFLPLASFGQTVHQDLQEIIEAEVLEVIEEGERNVFGTDTSVPVQTLRARLLSGSRSGEAVVFENEMVPLLEGDMIYLNYVKNIDGKEYFMFKDFQRHWQLLWLLVIFVGLLILFAGKQGMLALLSLGLSIGAIFFLLIPALLAGYNPALASLAIASVILAVVLFLTHGINPRSVIAFAGTFLAVLLTCLMAWFWVSSMRLTGFGSDIAVYLNFSTDGNLDFVGLLLGSIIIGILGVLDDVSITQASVVQELRRANDKLSFYELYQRSIRVGRDHVGSLVNTLALAYIGVSLPLVMLFAVAQSDVLLTLNQEMVAGELVRIIVGSIGLIMAVPFTTLIAAWYFAKQPIDELHPASHGHSHAH